MRIPKTLWFASFAVLIGCSEPVADETTEPGDKADLPVEDNSHKISIKEFNEAPFTLSVEGGHRWEIVENFAANSHDAEILDTMRTMSFKESVVHVVNHTYVDAFITNPEIRIIRDLRVGYSRKEFVDLFSDLEENESYPLVHITDQEIKIGCCNAEEQQPIWTFKFFEDTLDAIEYDQYYD